MSAAKQILNKSLKSKLVDLIRLRGPMTVAEYMKIVLTNPTTGFYMNKDVFGVKGHFTTSPEVSQIFGEILGVWIVQEWRRFGGPKPLRLVEFGPGRGTLMSDITRTIGQLTKEHHNIQLMMIEMSPKLQEIQRETLAESSKSLVDRTQWHTHIDAMKDEETRDGFTAFIAHEFLDALPVHKFVREKTTKRWRELMIDYDQKEDLRFCIGREPNLAARLLIPENFQGNHIEVCPEAALCLEKVAKRLSSSQSGCMLVCDYGFEESTNPAESDKTALDPKRSANRSDRDTFRAFKNHESWPALKDPGDADLTADVDFGYLKRHLRDKALLFGPVNQRNFLLKCGLQSRLGRLLERASPEAAEDLESGASFMTNEMGDRYKFLSIFPKGSEHLFVGDPPAGFDGTN